ncbi:penicillin acylase family protein [Inhella gelatinilytica]|uniref:Penicillin acylase family protein n=1 Tax=Inhella gelatinilytica TaxID=2795030 RepID=A0A931IUE2_9BURK|nr:penicillin acylase family protein [Inhella gelatinilytica]MBH9552940.1 penicillin acylase family protein [Inhella gelatinilytica]
MGFAALVVGLAGVAYLALRASLPVLDGAQTHAPLQAAVAVERDVRGTVTVRAQNRIDAAYAMGVAHAQDRFFQMDLMRRAAAGEVAALMGAPGLKIDRATRPHDFRQRAEAAWSTLPSPQQALIRAYTQGVNAGLAGLGARPPEYWLLRQRPQPWREVDSLLTVYAMYLNLQAEQLNTHRGRLQLRAAVGDDVADFLLARSVPQWDATLDGQSIEAPKSIPAPPAGWGHGGRQVRVDELPAFGSNAWAVAGRRAPHGAGLVANDMHLKLGLPNTWVRMAVRWTDARGRPAQWVGVTLPGVPGLVVGSTGQVAWGFTNSYVASHEWTKLQPDSGGQWRGPQDQRARLTMRTHRLDVAGSGPEELQVEWSPWGRIERVNGQTYAVQWTAYRPDAVNFGLFELEEATSVQDALQLAQRVGIPTQNQIVVDRHGALAWTLAGPLREGIDRPVVRDPDLGQLWSANHLHLGGAAGVMLGDGGYAGPGRAARIRDQLAQLTAPDEAQVIAIALDAEAPLLGRWRALVTQHLDAVALRDHPGRVAYREALNGPLRASADSVTYTLLRGFRAAALASFNAALVASHPGQSKDLNLASLSARWDEPVTRLLQEDPVAWRWADQGDGPLDARTRVLRWVDAEIERLTKAHGSLAQARWGSTDTIQVRHPLSPALPAWLASFLDAPPQPLVGDTLTPRAQARTFGASERLAVSPGREAQGLFSMPGGPSGHFLSPYYLSDHADWAQGQFGPLLPGAPQHRLMLRPSPTPRP